MWWWAAPYYVARIGEARPIFIVMAAMVAIGILVWENPRHWTLWIAEVGVGAIVLIFLSDRRDRSLSSAIVAVAQEGFSDGRCRWRLGHSCCLVRQLRSIVRCQL